MTSTQTAPTHVAGLDLQTATVLDLQAAMTDGRLTSRALTEAYQARIAALDGPLGSIRALSATALDQADQRDAERAAGTVRSPLHGVPVLVKDNVGTYDQPTTAGSAALEGLQPRTDAFLTARLRAAGAVILGKTNLSEFANWVDPSMPNGFSSLGGQVRCPYDLGDPSGSSSGSGVAAAMAFAALTVGSETAGSILSPSSVNGVVGVKPTRGLVSRAGVVPLAEGFDTAGPMTRSVTDAAALLTVLAGTDPADPATAPADSHRSDYLAGLDGASLDGVRLGWSRLQRDQADPEVRDRYDEALLALAAAGAVLVESEAMDAPESAAAAEIDLIGPDFVAHLDHYLATVGRPTSGVRSLAGIVAWNAARPGVMPYGQSLLAAAAVLPGDRDGAVEASRALRQTQAAAIDAGLARDDLAAFLAPGAALSTLGASAGYPSVIVPAGLAGGRGTGLCFLGTAWSEASLLRLALAYERVTTARTAPPEQVDAATVPVWP